MAQLCNIAMVEGLRLGAMGILKDGGNNVNPNYTLVGFDLHGSGGQGGVINALWKSREDYLRRCGSFLMSFFWFSLWLRWRSHAPGESYATNKLPFSSKGMLWHWSAPL